MVTTALTAPPTLYLVNLGHMHQWKECGHASLALKVITVREILQTSSSLVAHRDTSVLKEQATAPKIPALQEPTTHSLMACWIAHAFPVQVVSTVHRMLAPHRLVIVVLDGTAQVALWNLMIHTMELSVQLDIIVQKVSYSLICIKILLSFLVGCI
jgi:hypothetical protein